MLDAAWEAAIAYIDVARSYGRAEAFLGSWLATRRIGPAEATVGTKWGYTYTAGWSVDAEVHEVKDHGLATLRRQWGETRELLDGHVDLLQVHSATVESGILDDRGVHDELARLRSSGEVTAIGLSLSGAGQADTLHQAMTVVVDGRPLFDVVQATWNALEPSMSGPLADAHAAGMGVIVKEALANGRLVRGARLLRWRCRRAVSGPRRTRWPWRTCSPSRGPTWSSRALPPSSSYEPTWRPPRSCWTGRRARSWRRSPSRLGPTGAGGPSCPGTEC